jgi:hypothetical protein
LTFTYRPNGFGGTSTLAATASNPGCSTTRELHTALHFSRVVFLEQAQRALDFLRRERGGAAYERLVLKAEEEHPRERDRHADERQQYEPEQQLFHLTDSSLRRDRSRRSAVSGKSDARERSMRHRARQRARTMRYIARAGRRRIACNWRAA